MSADEYNEQENGREVNFTAKDLKALAVSREDIDSLKDKQGEITDKLDDIDDKLSGKVSSNTTRSKVNQKMSLGLWLAMLGAYLKSFINL